MAKLGDIAKLGRKLVDEFGDDVGKAIHSAVKGASKVADDVAVTSAKAVKAGANVADDVAAAGSKVVKAGANVADDVAAAGSKVARAGASTADDVIALPPPKQPLLLKSPEMKSSRIRNQKIRDIQTKGHTQAPDIPETPRVIYGRSGSDMSRVYDPSGALDDAYVPKSYNVEGFTGGDASIGRNIERTAQKAREKGFSEETINKYKEMRDTAYTDDRATRKIRQNEKTEWDAKNSTRQRYNEMKAEAKRRDTEFYEADRQKKANWQVKEETVADMKKERISGEDARRAIDRVEEHGTFMDFGGSRKDRTKQAMNEYFNMRMDETGKSKFGVKMEHWRNKRRPEGATSAANDYEKSAIHKFKKKEFDLNYGDISEALKSDNLSEDTIKKLASKGGFTDEDDIKRFSDFIGSGNKEEALRMVKDNETNFINNVSPMDKVFAYRVPQKAAFGVGTAYLVSAMANRKGQQSNAELYGQRTPYM
mgnify:CR=1 FL=1